LAPACRLTYLAPAAHRRRAAAETPQRTFCPRSRLPEFLAAFAMTGHEHLHRRPGAVLPDDVLRQICAFLW